MNSCSKCSDHSFDLCISVNFIQTCLFNIQNFTSKWKDCLCCTVSGCLCRTTGGISLYDVDLTVFQDPCQNSLQVFPASDIPSRLIFFLSDLLLFLQPLSLSVQAQIFHSYFLQQLDSAQGKSQAVADYSINCTSRLTVSKFLLCLSFKLRILDLDTDDCSKTLTDIITCKIRLTVF